MVMSKRRKINLLTKTAAGILILLIFMTANTTPLSPSRTPLPWVLGKDVGCGKEVNTLKMGGV